MSGDLLLGDIGGTNARFAVSKGPGDVRAIRTCQAADYPRFADALTGYLAQLRANGEASIQAVRIAAAGPLEASGQVSLTNSPWQISTSELCRVAGVIDAKLFNDLEAVALGLPHLPRNELRSIGNAEGAREANGNLLAVNVGTGFGAAIAVMPPDGPASAIATEAGHMTFAPRTGDEAILAKNLGSIEDFLSGAGVVDAYRIFSSLQPGTTSPHLESAQHVFAASTDTLAAAQTVRTFTSLLARLAGDLVLATGSWGGCFFSGSVVHGWAESIDSRHFRDVFTAKGKMSERMHGVPTRLILSPQPALFGLSFTR